MLKIICVLKSGGNVFDSDYVQNLRNNLVGKINIPFEFICYSDIRTPWTKPLQLNLKGWWSKVEIFQETGPCIYFDLDTCIIKDISELANNVVNNPNSFWMLRPMTERRTNKYKYTSGIMGWNGDFSFVFNEFSMPEYGQDQLYFVEKMREKDIEIEYVNNIIQSGAIQSYKRETKKKDGFDDNLRICVFHGNPRPKSLGFPFWTIKGEHKKMNIASMENIYLGETLFICASGPSLANIDQDLINQPGIITMGLNNSPAEFRPHMWVHVDPAQKFLASIWADPTILKFSPRVKQNSTISHKKNSGSDETVKNKYKGAIVNYDLNTKYDKDTFLSEPSVNFGCNKENGGGRSVLMAAIKIAYILGFRKVFLLGVDFKMEIGEQNYCFEQERIPSSVRGNNRTYASLNERFDEMERHFKLHKFEVFNCNMDSGLKSFPFIKLDEAVSIALEDFPDPEQETTFGMYDGEGKKRKKRSVNRKNKRGNKKSNARWRDDITLKSKKQIAITGMSRSGTHAVTDWVASQHNGRVEFRNNIFRGEQGGFKLYDPWGRDFPDRLYKLPSMTGEVDRDADIDLVAYTYENQHGSMFRHHPLIESEEIIKTVLIRDPYNLLATLGKHVEDGRGYWFARECATKGADGKKHVDPDKLHYFADMWLSHVELAKRSDVTPILYNKWKDSREYRNDLALKLNVDCRSDDSMKRVPANGRGSSFNKMDMDGNGEEMKTLERWRYFENTDWFKEFFLNNQEVAKASHELFGEIEGTDCLFE